MARTTPARRRSRSRAPAASRPTKPDRRACPARSGRARARRAHLRGRGRRHAQGLLQRDAHQMHGIAHGRGHVQRGAGEPAVLRRAAPVPDLDPLRAEGEARHRGADRRHRVGHQEQPARPRLVGEPQARRMHVVAIDDDAAGGIRGQRGAHGAGLACAQLRHGVEQVGEAADPGGEPGADFRTAAIGMAREHDGLARQGFDRRGGHAFRRQGEQRPAAPQRGQERDIVRAERADLRRVVHALPGRIDVRPLEMDAEHARHPAVDRAAHRADRARHGRTVGGDQSR